MVKRYITNIYKVSYNLTSLPQYIIIINKIKIILKKIIWEWKVSMVRILNDAIYDEFMQLVENSNEEIKLCVPFIKENIVDDIFTYKKPDVRIRMITNVKLMSFYKKVLDINGLLKIISSNGILYNYPILHAKMYIFDDNKLIISSANLTEAGLKKNKEYGIITDERDLIKIANDDFDNICNDEITGKVKKEHLDEIQKIIDSLPKETKIELPKYEIENDEIFSYSVIQSSSNLSGWKKDIYDIIVKFTDDHFALRDFDIYLSALRNMHPYNKHVEAKVRQILQQLRDLGLITFEGNGKYMRLFK